MKFDIGDLNKKIEQDSTDFKAYLDRAKYYFNELEYIKATEDCFKVIKINKTCEEAYLFLYKIFNKRKNEIDLLINFCDKMIEDDSSNFRAFSLKGAAYYLKKEFDTVIALQNKAISLNNNYSPAYTFRAHTYGDRKEYEKAIADYDKAIELDINYAYAYNGRGCTYSDLNEHKKAIEDYNKAIEIDFNYVNAYNNRGLAYADLKEYEKAIEDYNKTIELDINYFDAYANRGNAYFYLKEYEKALTEYNKVLKNDINNANAYTNRGNTYFELKKYEKAIVDYNKALEIDIVHTNAYNNRGNAYSELKEYEKAIEDYNKALEIDTKHASAYNNRGSAYFELKKYEKAIADYNKALEINENNIYAYYNRANVFFTIEKYKEALLDYNKVMILSKQNKNAYLLWNVEDNIIKTKAQIQRQLSKNDKTSQLMELIKKSNIENEIKNSNKIFKDFLTMRDKDEIENSEFIVLRRWNSYTPIVTNGSQKSKGGGYFFKIKDNGIVIDPGFNFIDNFISNEQKFQSIDHIFISHAHNDHTSDLESILTLLHQHKNLIKGSIDKPQENSIISDLVKDFKSSNGDNLSDENKNFIEKEAAKKYVESIKRKRIKLYMSVSTYKKYSSMLELKTNSDYDVIIIKEGDKFSLANPNIHYKTDIVKNKQEIIVEVIKAKHDDQMSDKDSLGLIFNIVENKISKFTLLYTGDTGYNEEIGKLYKRIKDNPNYKNLILLAHLGGFKSCEEKYDPNKSDKDNELAFYNNHLGRIGLVKLVEIVKPKICIISEFGEEFKNTRLDLVKLYEKIFKKEKIFFFPADIKFKINTDYKVCAIVNYNLKYDYINPSEIDIYNSSTTDSLVYFKKDLDVAKIIENLLTQKDQESKIQIS